MCRPTGVVPLPTVAIRSKRQRCQVEDMVLSPHARGMSTRDITEHLCEVYGASVSAATISRVTDVVADEIAAWQSRPVDTIYPILDIDAGIGSSRPRGPSSGTGVLRSA